MSIGVVGNDVPRQLVMASGGIARRLGGAVERTDRRAGRRSTGCGRPRRRRRSHRPSRRTPLRLDGLIVCNDSQSHLRLFYILRMLAGGRAATGPPPRPAAARQRRRPSIRDASVATPWCSSAPACRAPPRRLRPCEAQGHGRRRCAPPSIVCRGAGRATSAGSRRRCALGDARRRRAGARSSRRCARRSAGRGAEGCRPGTCHGKCAPGRVGVPGSRGARHGRGERGS